MALGRSNSSSSSSVRPASIFDALNDPEKHAKILIDPKSTAAHPVSPA